MKSKEVKITTTCSSCGNVKEDVIRVYGNTEITITGFTCNKCGTKNEIKEEI